MFICCYHINITSTLARYWTLICFYITSSFCYLYYHFISMHFPKPCLFIIIFLFVHYIPLKFLIYFNLCCFFFKIYDILLSLFPFCKYFFSTLFIIVIISIWFITFYCIHSYFINTHFLNFYLLIYILFNILYFIIIFNLFYLLNFLYFR